MNARRRPCSAGPLQGGAVALASGLPGWVSTAGPGLSETARPPLGGWGQPSAAGLGLSETASPALAGWGPARPLRNGLAVGLDRWAWPLRNGQAAAGWVGAGLGRWARPLRNGLACAGWVGPPSMPGWGLAYDRPFALAPSPPCRGYAPRRRAPLPVPWCGGAIS